MDRWAPFGHIGCVVVEFTYQSDMDDPFILSVLSPALPSGTRPHAHRFERTDCDDDGEVPFAEKPVPLPRVSNAREG